VTQPKRIVVVGGVAGGMSCAARARRLDEAAEIIVLERGPHVSFANCGLPYYIGGEITDPAKLLVQTPASLRAALNLDVRPQHAVTGVDSSRRVVFVEGPCGPLELSYDALVLSPGAVPIRPPITGLDSPRVQTVRTVDDALTVAQLATAGSPAVVLGAGFIGLEVAEALAARGLAVTVVELAEHVLPPLEREMAQPVEAELARLGIEVLTGVAAVGIEDPSPVEPPSPVELVETQPSPLVEPPSLVELVETPSPPAIVRLADGSALPADLIVLSVGARPDTDFLIGSGVTLDRGAIVVDEHGRTNVDGIWAVGDAVASTHAVTGASRPVALAGPANRAGRLVADDIVRPRSARPIPQPVGTAIVRVGDLAVAITGANSAELTGASRAFSTLHLHPNQHAGYFPGAQQLHLLLHISPDDGRVLGAQAVGPDGVDKRIDVLATAIRAGRCVGDLIDLDLAYSPPYGQAKDAVNLAGMVGSNVLDGTLRLWYAADLDQVLSEALVLDVRSGAEVATGTLPGALTIPHTELRGRLDEVAAAADGRPVRVLCASGVRSAIAHRVLTQAGFDSASLSGGMLTLRAHLGATADDVLVTPVTV
jgi:NADPH-dependent 2,4-dienoyl-CoA reductase/sulfur reductase-like enzyme/rhodanese-related sulfurtransferase